MSRISLDSNILIYALLEPDSQKGQVARHLIARVAPRGLLPVQVLGEYLWVVRRRRPDLLALALERVDLLRQVYATVATELRHIQAAGRLAQRFQLQLWDAVILEVSSSHGAVALLSEDMQDGLHASGLRIVNPFAATSVATLDALLDR